MVKIISIPTPCHEDWNAMTQNEQGRHCSMCSKTVVDFTLWQPQEILFYLERNAHQKVCGRFNTIQLGQEIISPEDFVKEIAVFPMSALKKAAAIFLFTFMIGATACNTSGGKIAVSQTPPLIEHPLLGDTISFIKPVGEPPIQTSVQKDTIKKIKGKCTGKLITDESRYISGDIQVIQPIITNERPIVEISKDTPVIDNPVIMGKMIAVVKDTVVKKPEHRKKQ